MPDFRELRGGDCWDAAFEERFFAERSLHYVVPRPRGCRNVEILHGVAERAQELCRFFGLQRDVGVIKFGSPFTGGTKGKLARHNN